MNQRFWQVVYWSLTAAFVLAAALNVQHIRAGFFTNHLADLVVPAWMYIVARGLAGHRPHVLSKLIGATPERAALILFVASAASEASQYWWPHGLFPGRFDPLDIVAYAVSVGACYIADRSATRAAVR